MLQKLDLVAPRAGRIDSIPYKLGDQAPVGAPLVVMLVGDAPHARVYVPEPLRAGVAVGQRARVFVGADDGEQGFEGTRSEEHTSELQSLMRPSYAVFRLKKNKQEKYHLT